ncbi:MAG: dual specificity protein phosphatase family protein [Saezia sp.]
MKKYLLAHHKPFNILFFFIIITALMGCRSPFPETAGDEFLLQRPTQWAAPLNKEMNLFEIEPGLYRSQQPLKEDMAAIEALGIKTIINLRGFHADNDTIKNTEITLVRIPIHTWHIRDHHVVDALKAIEEARQQGPVLIHCLHGADRTGLVSAMYRIVYQGWSKEAAWQELKKGGFGYHSLWINIPNYIYNADIGLIKSKLEHGQ